FAVRLLLSAEGWMAIVVSAVTPPERRVGGRIPKARRHLLTAAVVATGVFAGIAGFLTPAFPSPPRPPLVADTTPALGRALVGPFAVTFELLALLLVVALLGALYFARTDE